MALLPIDFIYFQNDISTEASTLISMLLWHFCDLECKKVLAKDLLDWCWEERKKNSAHSRCFFSTCCAYYFEKLTLLKNRFQMFFTQQEWMCVAQLEVWILFKEANWRWMMKQWINSQECFAFYPSISSLIQENPKLTGQVT